jgi:cellobiose phosphorylase
VPQAWPGYAIEYRHGGTTYRVAVELTDADGPEGPEIAVDGRRLAGASIALVDDGLVHDVVVRVSRRPTPVATTAG